MVEVVVNGELELAEGFELDAVDELFVVHVIVEVERVAEVGLD
jgi:hypothetical protein